MPLALRSWLLSPWLLIVCLAIFTHLSASKNARAQQDWGQSLRARGGLSYLQDPADSQVGALYGLDLSVPVFEQANLYGSFTHNHFDQGSQYLGTLGIYDQGLAGGGFWERMSGGLLFDQYTDTRFDGLYLSQLRSFTGFALREQLGIGMTYTNPLEDADLVMVALPGGGAGPVIFRNAEMIEAYLSMQFGQSLLTATVGQRQAPNDFVASLHATHSLSSQVSLYTNTSYADSHSWAATFGLQWTFGPGSRPGLLASTNETAPTLVRAQNHGGRPNPFSDPSLGHNLNLDPQRFGSLITISGGGITPLGTTGGTDTTTDDDIGGTPTGGPEVDLTGGETGDDDPFRIELDYSGPPT